MVFYLAGVSQTDFFKKEVLNLFLHSMGSVKYFTPYSWLGGLQRKPSNSAFKAFLSARFRTKCRALLVLHMEF